MARKSSGSRSNGSKSSSGSSNSRQKRDEYPDYSVVDPKDIPDGPDVLVDVPVVKVDKIIPGNALLQPSLIARMQTDLQGATSDAYAQQFIAAAGKYLKLERHPEAIAAAKKRIITPSN